MRKETWSCVAPWLHAGAASNKIERVTRFFWEFIKPERDRILKENRSSVEGFGIADPAILRFDEAGEIYDWGEEEETLYLDWSVLRLSDYSLPNDAVRLLYEARDFWTDLLWTLELAIVPYVMDEAEIPF